MAGSNEAFRFIDLFAGLGGFHVALKHLGGEGVFAAEWDVTLSALYKENFDIRPWGDVNDLVDHETIAREIPDHEVLTAGFPCQPFSKAGEQLGFGHTLQGQLFFKVLDILKEKRPPRLPDCPPRSSPPAGSAPAATTRRSAPHSDRPAPPRSRSHGNWQED